MTPVIAGRIVRVVNIDPVALRDRRIRAGHTTYSLAAHTDGRVSQQRISDLEAGPVGVRPTTAKALADALGCDITDITDIEATVR